jgi:hypothetical protein
MNEVFIVFDVVLSGLDVFNINVSVVYVILSANVLPVFSEDGFFCSGVLCWMLLRSRYGMVCLVMEPSIRFREDQIFCDLFVFSGCLWGPFMTFLVNVFTLCVVVGERPWNICWVLAMDRGSGCIKEWFDIVFVTLYKQCLVRELDAINDAMCLFLLM